MIPTDVRLDYYTYLLILNIQDKVPIIARIYVRVPQGQDPGHDIFWKRREKSRTRVVLFGTGWKMLCSVQ